MVSGGPYDLEDVIGFGGYSGTLCSCFCFLFLELSRSPYVGGRWDKDGLL